MRGAQTRQGTCNRQAVVGDSSWKPVFMFTFIPVMWGRLERSQVLRATPVELKRHRLLQPIVLRREL